jgi:glycoprotein 2-beta-D-xylosyltransferase
MSLKLKIIVSLFTLNSITLYLYLSPHPDYFRHRSSSATRRSLPDHHQRFPLSLSSHPKPWPILPSYLPWSLNSDVTNGSCEGYFGNGFTRRFDLLTAAGARGWFTCFYSDTLRSSICEGGRIRMHPDKIKMSVGGERLEEVIGRRETEELPVFYAGAFDVEVDHKQRLDKGKKLMSYDMLHLLMPKEKNVKKHTMRDLVDSIQLVHSADFECSEWVEEPTLLVTRFEYANLFHTVTDWYSAYVASRVTGLPHRPHLVFVDGHCTAPLDETWNAMFSSVRYAKKIVGPVCFRHAILSPLGYETVLFKGLDGEISCQGASAQDLWQAPDDEKTARLSEFGEMIRASFDFPVDQHRKRNQVSTPNVLFIRREDYLAHPRHLGKVESRLSNEQEVFDCLKSWVSNHTECKVNLIDGVFAHMPMKEQVRAIQDSSLIIGAHGAGLTHIVSATPKTVIFEIIGAEFRRPHFKLISKWKGLEYHPMFLRAAHADPAVVIQRLSPILRRFGC